MNAISSTSPQPSPALALFAKLVVVAAFVLIFSGGHTTTAGAGMAFPDWPLSNGSLNPDGWLTDFFKWLEHSHRLTAGLVASLAAILFGWVVLERERVPRGVVSLAGWALAGVLAQALLGGLRVILDPQGIAATNSTVATTFRVLHGTFAQIELCLLVWLAALLSPVWTRIAPSQKLSGLAKLGRIALGLILLQLIVGATMRHLGAGLAIPTFPQASPDGSWLPKTPNLFVALNFTHTRIGAVIVTLLLLHFAESTLRKANGDSGVRHPALLLRVLILAQFALGVSVIWNVRPPLLTTLHVVNGAAVLAATVLLTVRLSRAVSLGRSASLPVNAQLTEARA